MFEKATPVSTSLRAHAGGRWPDNGQRASQAGLAPAAARFDMRHARRAGDALRAVEWTEITARLNAARDLRLLLRNELQAPIEAVAASFGDAAASYFALLDDGEPVINPDALEQSKVLGPNAGLDDAGLPGLTAEQKADAAHGDAREMQ
jgi:hypothetical protein